MAAEIGLDVKITSNRQLRTVMKAFRLCDPIQQSCKCVKLRTGKVRSRGWVNAGTDQECYDYEMGWWIVAHGTALILVTLGTAIGSTL